MPAGSGRSASCPTPNASWPNSGAQRSLTRGRPLAANLLLPFTRPAHVEACIVAGIDLVVLFCGSAPGHVARLRGAGVLVFQQVGSGVEARKAIDDGVDGLIAQGVEAGGHLLGIEPTVSCLEHVLDIGGTRPVLAAGGVASAERTRTALDAGALAVVAGTRFLLTEECAAHPGYKQRVLGATRTIDTMLFSMGWSDRHRVIPNLATDRWCSRSDRGPSAVVALNRWLAPALQRLPPSAATATLSRQRVGVPFFGPAAVLEGMNDKLLDVTPLYAGDCARDIDSVLPAAEAVALLDPS